MCYNYLEGDSMKEKIIKLIETPLIMSILLFILGAILFTNPANIVKIVTYGFGGLFLFLAFIKFVNYLGSKKKGVPNNNDLINSVLMLVMGLVVILCTSIIELVIRIIMGGFILYNGVTRLITSLKIKEQNNNLWKGNLVIAIIIIAVGLYIILRSNLVFSGIGLFIMIYSGLEIALAIMSYNSVKTEVKKIEEKEAN